MQLYSFLPTWICDLISCMGGCFGRCGEPPPSTGTVDKSSKVLKIQDQQVKKSDAPEDFWSSSSCEMDHSSIQSRSVSSIGMSNSSSNAHIGTSNPSEFVNHGLILWNNSRQEWRAGKTSSKPAQVQEHAISWNATYESLLSNNKPYPRPIPLPEMVDFLVDVWEHEGLYD